MEIDWSPEARIAVAVSGGVDSMVLLDKVRCSKHYNQLFILHVNHGLRDQSIDEEQMIVNYAKKHHIPYYIAHVPKDYFEHQAVQQASREFRYRFFEEMKQEHNIDIVLTAHHQQDQIETVLFRLLTGRFYLQSIGIKNEGHYLRPLLGAAKQELYQYAETFDVPYMEDASNKESHYTRNTIRNKVLPVINEQKALNAEHLVEFAEWQKDALLLMEKEAAVFLSAADDGLNRQQFNALLPSVKYVVIKQWVELHIDTHLPLKKDYIDEIIRVSLQHTPQATYEINSLWCIEIVYDKLKIMKRLPITTSLSITSPGKYIFNDFLIEVSGHFEEAILVRTYEQGDRIKIGDHHQKVNRMMINEKVPRYNRLRLPIILIKGEIIAVGNLKQTHHPMLKNMKIIFKGEDKHA